MNQIIKAVLFDLDGTLLDTEKYYRRMWPKAAEHFGYHMTDEEALSLRSLGRPFAIEKIEKMMQNLCSYEEIRSYRKQLIDEVIKNEGIQAKQGASELLSWLKNQNYTTAVVTASGKDYAEKYLSQLDLFKYFDHIISATMVKNGKPAPDVYSYACNVLQIEPNRCLAVEDSPNGVSSAFSAGCKVVMVPDQTPPSEEDLKNIVISCSSLEEIIDYLNN